MVYFLTYNLKEYYKSLTPSYILKTYWKVTNLEPKI